MPIKPIKHKKIIVVLNDETPTDIISLELRIPKDLWQIIKQISTEQAKTCDCEACKKHLWDHFFANLVCLARQDSIEDYVQLVKKSFKGNTWIGSNLRH